MKTIVKRLVRDEKGASLVMVLILLLISGLIIGPLLSYMGTGLITGGVYETRTAELYAADAGVEDAIWKIQHGETPVCAAYRSWTYPSPLDPPIILNGKSVQVTIEYQDDGSFKITSTAITDDGGGTAAITGTEIEAYVTPVSSNFTGLLDNVITSQNDIEYPNNPEQYDLTYPEGHGPVDYYEGTWPTPEDLARFYWEDVKDEEPYDSETIDLEGEDDWIGPLYRIGELEIENSINPEATLTLTGTLYITGDTLISPTKDLILDLNGHTIFVESSSVKPPKEALYIGGKCTIIGPGVIIAVGDIHFEPNIPAGMTDPIFILSVSGTTTLLPGGDFYGAIAGSVMVDLQPNTSLDYPEAGFGDGINFPGFGEPTQLVYSIASWEVIPLWRE